MSMAVRQQFGHLGQDAARGLELRHDHGSAFMAEDFQNQIKAWGARPSYAFVGQPETNGVVERFFRTFKEQVVHGRIFQSIDDFRDAVRDFVARYNAEWLIEKNGHLSPHAAREKWNRDTAPRAA
jgi:transposase InsO family protein